MSENLAVKATLLMLLTVPFFSFIQSTLTSRPSPPPRRFNLSHFIFPRGTALTESNASSKSPHKLQGVLSSIASKEKWALEDIRVSQLDLKKARYGSAQVKEFRVRVRKSEIMLKMYKEALEWKKMSNNISTDFETLVTDIDAAKSLIDSFKIEGPCELWIVGDSDRFLLVMPFNITRAGLRRVSVGEGITVEVKGAQEISMFHPLNSDQSRDRIFTPEISGKLRSNGFETCRALMPIRITGSASVMAYRTQRPSSPILTVSFSRDAVKLMPEKCYEGGPNYNNMKDRISSLNLGVSFVGKLLSRFLDQNSITKSAFRSLKETVSASTVFRFHLELERRVRENDTYWSTLASWRTRPIVERVFFEVTAIIEGDILKPLSIKKVRPFFDVDSFAWSSLLSNLSFSKFPSLLVYPEALTLDVDW